MAGKKQSDATRKDVKATRVTAQRMFVRDLTITSHLGVSERERAKPQRLRINVELEVDPQRPIDDDPQNIVDYRWVVPSIREIARDGAPRLLESLADRIAESCFYDPRTRRVRVRIEKLDRYSDAAGVGIEVEHERGDA